MTSYLIFWIMACILFTILEVMTQQLVAMWFVAGSLAALLLSIFEVDMNLQLLAFVVVSTISLVALRPLVKKVTYGKVIPTNSDVNVGEMAIVTTDFDSATHEGRIVVNNMDWAVKSIEDIDFVKGDRVLIDHIEGVKCLVRKMN